MSEKYSVTLQNLAREQERVASNRPPRDLDSPLLLCTLALLERLERLVKVLEQIRDRLPGQTAK